MMKTRYPICRAAIAAYLLVTSVAWAQAPARRVAAAAAPDLNYVFNTPRSGGAFDEEGKTIAAAANKYWAAFARTGDPGSAGGPTWPQFDTRMKH